jgi:hypothetical protein
MPEEAPHRRPGKGLPYPQWHGRGTTWTETVI